MGKKELQVAAIENGTVIDHIPAERTYQVARLLELEELGLPVTIGFNLPSRKLERKGIIKITDKFFSDEEISRLSVIAPKVVLNIIKDYEVVEKRLLKRPTSSMESLSVTIRNVLPTTNLCTHTLLLLISFAALLSAITVTKSKK